MSENIIAAKLQVDTDQSTQSIKSFKKELRDAEQDLLKIQERFGSVSPLAVEAAKKVAEMRDRIGDAKNLVDAFNPDAKFRSFSNAINGVAGGFSTVTGLMGLLGEDSENTQKALLKVQAALAFSQGLNQLGELKDTFKQLGSFIQSTTIYQNANNAATKAAAAVQKLFAGSVDTTSTSFKLLKGAMAAVGIGLFIALVSEVVSALQSWTSEAERTARAQEDLNKTTQKFANAGLKAEQDFINKSEKLEVARAEATGATEAQIFKIRESWQKQRIASQQRHYNEIKDTDAVAANDSKKAIEGLQADLETDRLNYQKKEREDRVNHGKKLHDLNKQQFEKVKADTKALLDELKKIQDENFLNSFSDEQRRAEEKIKIDADNERKRIEALKVATKEGAEAKRLYLIEINRQEQIALAALNDKFQKENEEKRKAANDVIRKLDREHALILITDERERKRANIEQDYQDAINAANEQFKALEITEQEKTDLLIRLKIQRQDALDAVDAERKEKQDALKLELDELDNSEFENKLAQLDEWYKQKLAIAQGNEELLTQVHKQYEEQRTAITKFEKENQVRTLVGAFAQIGGLFAKHTAAYKVTALAEIAANTAIGYIQGLDIAQKTAKGTGPAAAFAFPIFYATQIAAVLGAAAKAKGILKNDSGGGSAAASASAPSPATLTPIAPLTPKQEGTKVIGSDAGNAAAGGVDRVIRAYVLDGDIQNNAERNARLNRAARLGG
jgi:hypothetical protein